MPLAASAEISIKHRIIVTTFTNHVVIGQLASAAAPSAFSRPG
jgi:hypothetical protein